MRLNKSQNTLDSVPLFGVVRSTYAFNVVTGQMVISCGNDGKKNSFTGFPCLDCLARECGIKITPSGLSLFPLRFSCDKSADLDGRVNANNIAVFQLSCFRERESLPPHEEICNDTVCTFHVLVYLGNGGLSLKTPFISLVTSGCCPTVYPSTLSCTDEIAER